MPPPHECPQAPQLSDDVAMLAVQPASGAASGAVGIGGRVGGAAGVRAGVDDGDVVGNRVIVVGVDGGVIAGE